MPKEFTLEDHMNFMMDWVGPRIWPGHLLVLNGVSALQYNGLCMYDFKELTVLIDNERLDNILIHGRVHYIHKSNIDYSHYLSPHPRCSCLLLPTKERAIVEIVETNLKGVSEEEFLEALNNYFSIPEFCNEPLLREVAAFFNVSYSKIEYWKNEMIDYYQDS